MILRSIGITKGNVAHHTERDKLHLIDIAGLGNGARLHIDSLRLREMTDNLAHLFLGIHEPVARDDQAGMNLDIARQRQRLLQQPRSRLIAGRQTLHLTILRTVINSRSAIHVMIGQLRAHHHVLNVHVVAISAGTAAGDDDIGMKLVNHTLGTKGGIHLADATLLYHHISVSKQRLELAQLLIHRHDNTYFHSSFSFLMVQSYKKTREEQNKPVCFFFRVPWKFVTK